VPPQFAPKEGRKDREKKGPQEAHSVDKIVDDIMRKYREEQRKRGLVDNWGQPQHKLDRRKVKQFVQKELEKMPENTKRTKKKAVGRLSDRNPLESMSEAIGRKFKQQRESKSKSPTREKSKPKTRERSKPKESQKSTPKPIESRKTTTKSKEKTNPKSPAKKEQRERLGPKVNMKPPEVNGEKIESRMRLRELMNCEYSAIKKKKDFPQRMRVAEAHQDLLKKYDGKDRLKYGDIAKIAKELDLDPQTVSNWITKEMTPRLYTYMEWSTPKSEAIEKVRRLKEANGGVQGPADVNKRFGNYYLEPEERDSKFAKREEQKMLKYYQFLDRFSEGGNFLDIAKEVGLSESGARAYMDGATPRWAGLAGQIPSETPREGYKWLPTKYDHGGHGGRWSEWIDVPEKVTNHKQVMEVFNKLKPLDNADMRKWDKLYGGDYTPEERVMHLLGTYVSDAGVPSSSTGAISMGMNLSKKYDWSETFGDVTCYHLGHLGIRAGRVKDAPAAIAKIETKSGTKEIRSEEQFKWMSENSPLLRWMRRSCLGYNESPKTYQKLDADWILKSPENYRRSFLQGWSDGDGGVSKKSYYFTISTHSDHDFVEKLLGSFGIETYRSRTYIRTAGFDAVCKVEKIPPFKYATDRQDALEKTVQMIESRRNSWKSNPPSKDELDFMKDLRQKGMPYGGIGEKLFDKYGYSMDARDVRRLVLGREKRKNGGRNNPP
jgi:hypothetical protein